MLFRSGDHAPPWPSRLPNRRGVPPSTGTVQRGPSPDVPRAVLISSTDPSGEISKTLEKPVSSNEAAMGNVSPPVTEGGIFLQRLVENIFKGQGQSGIQLRRRNRRRMQDASENEGSGRAGKWNHARGHLIQHSAKRKQIRACVQLLAARLFRRHVRDRAHGTARTRQLLFV